MIAHLRKLFNESFSQEKYRNFLDDLNKKHPGAIQFRVAETPVFVPADFRDKMISACESIVDIITAPGFIAASNPAIPPTDFVPGKEDPPQFIAFDFGVCLNDAQELEPQLIEMQGFPTLYGFQVYYPEMVQKHFSMSAPFTQYLGGFDRPSYLKTLKKNSLGDHIDLKKDWDVQWIPHPNWFYRISKHTLPFINHPYVPETRFLDQIQSMPMDLENYVLKPLFSFAGQGVVIDIRPEDISSIKDPANWILQKKVSYASVIKTPDDPAKVEIRIMYLWPQGAARPVPAINLARLSKGKMIGVRYNQDRTWVGGSVAFFPGR